MSNFKKDFFNNLIGLGSLNILNLLIPIITMPILSRSLGSEGYGIVLLFSSVCIFMMVIVDYSVNINGVRDLAVENENPSLIYERYQGVRLFFSLVFFIGALGYSFCTIRQINLLQTTEILSVSIVGYYLMAPWFHQGSSTLIVFSLFSVVLRILQVVLIIFLVQDKNDLLNALRINSYVFLINGILLYLYRRVYLKIETQRWFSLSFLEIKKGFGNFIGDFSPNLYSNLPPLIIGGIVSPHVFACYALALRLINIAGSFQTVICRSIYPLASRNKININFMLLGNILISSIPIGIILFFSDYIVTLLLGEGFSETTFYLKIGVIGVFMYSISSALMYGFFLPNRHDSIFRKVSIFSSVFPALIGYPLIYFMNATGAMLMFVFARTCFASLYFYFYTKYKR